ncbi:carbohydrate esterase family 9 protein [Protomyces lactucae-debilis]|uniref:N-acetylglucosamine-6-phosphate deacetylase n=1 Tax=Protomyces lactucae-debilis TaxID=2754530 RepID=A0A1Y2F0B6_PROLT|nr:carbohydrate esterase family 9 protein [Protomyces lactucae-debilis]ORY77341.1 carbohydrate esterase family 9 protein [Protomyces lactucae-debilis]
MSREHDWLTLRNCSIASEGKLTPSCQVVIDVTGGSIADVRVVKQDDFDLTIHRARDVDCRGHILTAGFMDLQLNGAWDFDFCTYSEDYKDKLEDVCRRLPAHGVTAFCPTLITSTAEIYKQVVPLLAPRQVAKGAQILGAHLEGPYLSPEKHGIHNPDWMKQASTSMEETYGKDYSSSTAIVTIAPEMDGLLDIVSKLVSQDIVVSLGHSAAPIAIAQQALDRGATMLTHLYNAMPSLHHRKPSLIDLLGQRTAPFFGLIADNIHVSPFAAALAYKANPEGCCLITDANSPLGMADGTYTGPHGMQLTKKGEAATISNGDIGGGASSLDTCFRNLLNASQAKIEAVVQTVNENPARVLGLKDQGQVRKGYMADLVLMTAEGDILKTFIRGQEVYSATQNW